MTMTLLRMIEGGKKGDESDTAYTNLPKFTRHPHSRERSKSTPKHPEKGFEESGGAHFNIGVSNTITYLLLDQ